MKQRIRSAVFSLLAPALMATGSSLLAADSPAGAASALRVGVSPNSPPMIFKEGHNIAGVEAELAQALGRELGRPVTFVEMPFEDLIDALAEDKIDIIMSSMSVTRARQFRVAFSEPYLRVGQMMLVRADEQYRFVALRRSLATAKLGLKKATTADLVAQQEFPKATRIYFTSGDEAAKALQKKKIDLFMSDSPMIWYLAGKYEAEGLVAAPAVITEETLSWATKRSDPQLLEAVNAFLKKSRANGELNQVLRRWMPKLQ